MAIHRSSLAESKKEAKVKTRNKFRRLVGELGIPLQ